MQHLFELGTLIDRYGTVCVEIISEEILKKNTEITKVSVLGVVALGSHFATLCWEFDFFEVKKCYYFSKRKGKYFYTFNHYNSEKYTKTAK